MSQSHWFNFSLGFANDGCDGDTVRHILGVLNGYTVHVEGIDLLVDPVNVVELDVVVDSFVQDEESPDGSWPMYLKGWMFDADDADDDDFRGAPVRIPLANSRITIL